MITDTIPQDVLDKIPNDASVGFIGDPSSTEYQRLRDAGLKVSDPMSPLDVQGREFDYVVVDNEAYDLEISIHWLIDCWTNSRMHWNTNMVPYIGNYNSFCRSAQRCYNKNLQF